MFPRADRLAAYWDNILNGTDCITDVPADQWRIEDFYDPDPRMADKTYSRRGGFVPSLPFDPMEFGIPPNTVEATSGLQLLSLILAKQTLLDTGCLEADWFDPARAGVVLGTAGTSQLARDMISRAQSPLLVEVLRSSGLTEREAEGIADKYKLAFASWQENTFPGILGNVVAGRIANRFNFGGLNCTTDAACASSLAAVNLAISELALGRADFMLAGGCDLENSPIMYLCFSKTPALSFSGTIKPFDEGNDGTMIGQGIGMMGLKRLADAERDGDRIYAVIRGMGSSSDGRFKSIYAPRAEGQIDAMKRAYSAADVPPESIRLIECHGTGTPIGDMVEIEALKGLFGDRGLGQQSIAIGTVKSQIGHAKCAAGAAGMIKAILSLHHRVLPPTINVTRPNKQMDLANSPFYPNVTARPWISEPGLAVRRAGVSAFGFGGTNFHCVLEEVSNRAPEAVAGWRRNVVYMWHADTPAALVDAIESDPRRLAGEEVIPADHHRLLIVAPRDSDPVDQRRAAIEYLGTEGRFDLPEGVFIGAPGQPEGKVAALFTGQGSQYTDMGALTAVAFPQVRSAFEHMAAAMAEAEGGDLGRVVFPPSAFEPAVRAAQQAALRATEYAQPAIGALAQGQYAVLSSFGLDPDGALGHSFGELTALWAAESLDDGGFRALALRRGRAMAECAGDDAGTMAAVTAAVAAVEALLADHPGLSVCNENAPDQVVVGGPTEAVTAFVEACAQRHIGARTLPVAAAFHTPLVAGAVPVFAAAVDEVGIGEPRFPVYADTAGAEYSADAAANSAVLSRQIVEPVRFAQRVAQLYDQGYRVFVEFGPKSVLSGMVSTCLAGRDDVTVVPVDGGPQADGEVALLCAVARLMALGVPLHGVNRDAPPAAPEVSHSPATVMLNGAEYVPERRRLAYEDALANGYTIERSSLAMSQSNNEEVEVHAVSTASGSRDSVVETGSGPVWQIAAEHLLMHRTYLSSQLSVADRMSRLLSAEADNGARSEVIEGISAVARHSVSISEGHVHASDVLRSFAELEAGTAVTPVRRAPLALTEYAPLAEHSTVELDATNGSAPTPGRASSVAANGNGANGNGTNGNAANDHEAYGSAPTGKATNGDAGAAVATAVVAPAAPLVIPTDPAVIGQMLIEVIADKTGYPPDMLDLGMSMEADLGIDSIKRVEILSSVQEKYPDVAPPSDPERVFSLTTLQDVADFILELGTEAQAAGGAVSAKEVMADPKADGGTGVVRRVVETVPLSAPDLLVDPYGPAPVGVVGGDDTALAVAFRADLSAAGWTVLDHPADRDRIDLAVWVVSESTDPEVVQGDLVDANMFVSAVLPALEAGADQHRTGLLTVTRVDGHLGVLSPDHAGALAAGVAGLVKTVGLESPRVFARTVDLDPSLEVQEASACLAEEIIDAEHALMEVGRGAGTRVTVAASAATPALTDKRMPATELGSDDVVVVTGGARGISAACAIEMATRCDAKFVLIGRTELEDEPSWADGVAEADLRRVGAEHMSGPDERAHPRDVDRIARSILAQREIRGTLHRLPVAEYLAVDVCDSEALSAALAPYRGRVAAIVHGAGTLMDKRIVDKSEVDVRRVLAPKLTGIAALLDAVDTDNLRHVVLFSSVAGFYGNVGQSDYAMANEALARIGVWLSHVQPKASVRAVAWGPWAGGMVRPELAKLFRDRGVDMIAIDVGARICGDLLSLVPGGPVLQLIGPPVHAVSRPSSNTLVDRAVVRRTMTDLYTSPVLADHRLAERVVVPASFAAGAMIHIAEEVGGFRARAWRKFSVLKGIIVDGSEPAELEFELRPGDDGVDVLAKDPGGRPRYRLTVMDESQRFDRPEPLELPPVGVGEPVTAYGDGTMFHGPSFQGMRRTLRRSENELVIECQIGRIERREPRCETDIYEPVLSDIALQVVGVWVRERFGESCLPASVERVDIYERLAFDATFVVRAHNLRRPSPNMVAADITLCAPSGVVLATVDTVAAIASDALNEVFRGGAFPGATKSTVTSAESDSSDG